ncbi:DUF4253 domain-containing protein [Thermosynechococcaceae cyanobacterium BACA0444]|uniref:DUF4253 domain-containing protein n=1 Tax=Pseudocalidococcus azoricus BACA0444 TaxID=2918990 RepID=A0AAE4JWV2_9CYAN|nr:DUF4253 domain-containing protein [Pseudocalidococcus azoricus]MDS3861795.1 DUF4253 domain-containing protein [Pseudocalidococcus azoricus BACA0444]
MLNDPAELAALIADTDLADHSILALDIPESNQKALAIAIELDQDLAAWQLMHSYGEQTQRYPVITTLWGADAGNWEQEIKGADLFSRFYYQEEAEARGHQEIAPAEIIARVAAVELEPLLSQESDLDDQAWEAELSYGLAITTRILGVTPSPAELQAFQASTPIRSRQALEWWLWNWEVNYSLEQNITPAMTTSHLDWFEPGMTKALLLLPTPHSWECLAYLHWFGACQVGTEVAMSFLKRWQEQYQAALVCHYGTMLQFQVGRPPQSLDAAWQLAWEQYTLAPYTLDAAGIAPRHQAQALLNLDRWFLHERP